MNGGNKMERSELDNIHKTGPLNYLCNDVEHLMYVKQKIEPEISLYCNQNGGYLGSISPATELAGVKLTEMTESLETRFNQHQEFGINGNTSLDDEFIDMIRRDSELDCLFKKDRDQSINPCSSYAQIIIKLCIFDSQDIETLITDYQPSQFWDSLDSAKRRELIEKTLSIQEEKEQEALESIGTENRQDKLLEKGICFTQWKGL